MIHRIFLACSILVLAQACSAPSKPSATADAKDRRSHIHDGAHRQDRVTAIKESMR